MSQSLDVFQAIALKVRTHFSIPVDLANGTNLNDLSGLSCWRRRAGRHRLLIHSLKRHIQAGPAGRACCPDIHAGPDGRGVVEIAHAHDSELWSRICSGEKMGAALWAEFARDLIATIRCFCVLGKGAGNGEC